MVVLDKIGRYFQTDPLPNNSKPGDASMNHSQDRARRLLQAR